MLRLQNLSKKQLKKLQKSEETISDIIQRIIEGQLLPPGSSPENSYSPNDTNSQDSTYVEQTNTSTYTIQDNDSDYEKYGGSGRGAQGEGYGTP